MRKVFLPTPPYVPNMAGLLIVVAGLLGFGIASGSNAALLSQLTQPAVAPHWPPAYGSAPATRVPRSCPSCVPDNSEPCKTVNGRPVWALTTPLYSQPPKTRWTNPPDPEKGNSHTNEATKRCVWSNSDGPRSNWCRSGSSQGRAEDRSKPVTPAPGGKSSMLFEKV